MQPRRTDVVFPIRKLIGMRYNQNSTPNSGKCKIFVSSKDINKISFTILNLNFENIMSDYAYQQ